MKVESHLKIENNKIIAVGFNVMFLHLAGGDISWALIAPPQVARHRLTPTNTCYRSKRLNMIIPVKIDKVAEAEAAAMGSGSVDGQGKRKGVCVPQWSMVELQGELLSKDPLSGQPFGSMASENVSRAICTACTAVVVYCTPVWWMSDGLGLIGWNTNYCCRSLFRKEEFKSSAFF